MYTIRILFAGDLEMQKSMNCFECLKSRFIYKKQFFVHNLRVWNEFDPHMSLLDLRKRHRHLQNGMVIHFGLWLWDFHRNFYINFFQTYIICWKHIKWPWNLNFLFLLTQENILHTLIMIREWKLMTKILLGAFFQKATT